MTPDPHLLGRSRVVWVGHPPDAARVVPHALCVASLDELEARGGPPGVLVLDVPPLALPSLLPRVRRAVDGGWSVGLRGPPPDPATAFGALCAGVFTWLADQCDDELLQRALAALAVQALHPAPPALDGEAHFTLSRGFEAEALTSLLAHADPQPLRRLPGMLELLLNAIEHGNLGFTGEQKHAHILEGRWDEMVRERFRDPQAAARRVRVRLARDGDTLRLRIEDEGPGFDHATMGARRLEEVQGPTGRGIAMARLLCFDALEFEDPGNVVVATMRREP